MISTDTPAEGVQLAFNFSDTEAVTAAIAVIFSLN
jgi:hypothetical protein